MQYNEVASNTTNFMMKKVGGTKRPFDVFDVADSQPVDRRSLDEVSLYNLAHVGNTEADRKVYVNDDYAVMRFWHERKKFPQPLCSGSTFVRNTSIFSS